MTQSIPRVVHVDDDVFTLTQMEQMFKQFGEVQYLGGFTDPESGIQFIKKELPEIAVLDINFTRHNGIELALALKDLPVSIVFLSGYSEYALPAYQANPLTFLSKPPTMQQLSEMVSLWKKRQPLQNLERTMTQLEKKILEVSGPSKEQIKKILIPTVSSTLIIDLSKLLLIEAKSNYTVFVLSDAKSITSSRNLKIYADALSEHPDFIRIHRSYIVNKHFVLEIKKALRGKTYLLMENGRELEVSSQQKESVVAKLRS